MLQARSIHSVSFGIDLGCQQVCDRAPPALASAARPCPPRNRPQQTSYANREDHQRRLAGGLPSLPSAADGGILRHGCEKVPLAGRRDFVLIKMLFLYFTGGD